MRPKKSTMLLFIAPAIILFLVFFCYPMLRTLAMSFFEVKSMSSSVIEWSFNGIQNFKALNATSFPDSLGMLLRVWLICGVVIFAFSLFFAVMLIRLFPVLLKVLSVQIWYAVVGILILRLCAYCVAAIKYRRFAPLHTWLNKLTGGAVFPLPYMLVFSSGTEYSWALCALACAASFEELVIHLSRESYDGNTKSILQNRIERRNLGRTK